MAVDCAAMNAKGIMHQCRRFEILAAIGASFFRNFKSKSGTGVIDLLMPNFPKFVKGQCCNGTRTSEKWALGGQRLSNPLHQAEALRFSAAKPQPKEAL
jgi:hypothetical protein